MDSNEKVEVLVKQTQCINLLEVDSQTRERNTGGETGGSVNETG